MQRMATISFSENPTVEYNSTRTVLLNDTLDFQCSVPIQVSLLLIPFHGSAQALASQGRPNLIPDPETPFCTDVA